jgi:hypothetical protein
MLRAHNPSRPRGAFCLTLMLLFASGAPAATVVYEETFEDDAVGEMPFVGPGSWEFAVQGSGCTNAVIAAGTSPLGSGKALSFADNSSSAGVRLTEGDDLGTQDLMHFSLRFYQSASATGAFRFQIGSQLGTAVFADIEIGGGNIVARYGSGGGDVSPAGSEYALSTAVTLDVVVNAGASTINYTTESGLAGSLDADRYDVFADGVLVIDDADPATSSAPISAFSLLTTNAATNVNAVIDTVRAATLSDESDTGDFILSVTPSTVITGVCNQITYDVDVTPSGGFSASVYLAAEGLPAGVTPTFAPAVVTPPGTATVTLTMPPGLAVATYPFAVRGVGGGKTHYKAASFSINSTLALEFTLALEVVDPPGAGTLTADPETGPYACGDVVTLTATPDDGYQVKAWTNTDDDTSTAETNTVTLVADTTVYVEFEPLPDVQLTAGVLGGNGTIDPVEGTYSVGTVVDLTATPNEGYRVKTWTGTDNDALKTNANTVTMTADKTVTVRFEVIPPQATLDITVDGNGTVSVFPEQETWDVGTEVTVTAQADEGWHFVEWQGDLSGETSPATLTLDADKAVTAVFEEDPTYNLTITVVESDWGTVTPDPLEGPYEQNSTVTLTAAPADGYRLVAWQGTKNDASTALTNTVKMDGDKTVTVTFEPIPTYTLTLSVVGENGTLTADPDQVEFLEGTVVNLTATPDYGYRVKAWTGTNNNTLKTKTNTVTMTADKTVTVEFEEAPYYELAAGVLGGHGTLEPVSDYRPEGYVIELTATPDDGYRVKQWTGTDDDTSTETTNTVTMTSDKTVTVRFELIPAQYTLTTAVTGDGTLAVEPTGPSYDVGTIVMLTALPADSWRLKAWAGTDDDASTDLTNTVTMDADKTVTVEFEETPPQYTLTASVVGSHGSVTPAGGTYDEGDVVTLTATPDDGYRVKAWTGTDDDTSTEATNTVTLNADRTVTVEFEEIPAEQYTLTLTTEGQGSVTLVPTGTTYTAGTIVTLTPAPATGWHFVEWQNDLTGATAPAQLTMDADKAVTAVFEEDDPTTQYALTVNVTGNGTVTLDPTGGTYDQNTTVTLTATAELGWHFLEWQGDLTGTDNPATVTIDADKAVTAVFEEDDPITPQYTLTVNVAGNGTVTLDPTGGTYDENTVVTLTAEADTGWHFVEWQGDLTGTDNPATVTIDADKAVTAVFEEDDPATPQYTLTVDTTGQGTVTLDPSGGTYDENAAVTLTTAADAGWHFVEWQGDLTGSTNPVAIVMNTDKTITAVFQEDTPPALTYTLTLLVVENGWGTVTADPAAGPYAADTTVTLTAAAAEGYRFAAWLGTGDDTITDPTNAVTMDADRTVTATFEPTPTYTLTVTVDGVGGAVAWDPIETAYAEGTVVTLTAAPDDEFTVEAWLGTDDDTSTELANTVTMDADRAVSVRFGKGSQPPGGSGGGGAVGGGASSFTLRPPDDLTLDVALDRVTLTWSDGNEAEDGYEIERQTVVATPTTSLESAWEPIGATEADAETFIDTTVAPGATIRYRVRAFAGTQHSLWAETEPVTIPAAPPRVPEGFVLVDISTASVTITWTDIARDESGYLVERAGEDGAWTALTELAPDTTVYEDYDVMPATHYRYRVAAFNDVGQSAWLTSSSFVTPSGESSEPAPAAVPGSAPEPAQTPSPQPTLSAQSDSSSAAPGGPEPTAAPALPLCGAGVAEALAAVLVTLTLGRVRTRFARQSPATRRRHE